MIAFADLAGQSALIGQLQSDFARGRYVHAYLLTGPGGTGKRSAAQLCAMAALCRGEKKPCGACGPCRRVLSGTHPDVHTVVPEKGKQIISVFSQVGYTWGKDSDYDGERAAQAMLKSAGK